MARLVYGFVNSKKMEILKYRINRHVYLFARPYYQLWCPLVAQLPSTIVGGMSAVGSAALSAPGFEKRVDDAGLMVALNRALLQEDDTLLLKIKIDALAGRLMLTGTVQDEAAHKTLQKIVGETDGIRQVFDYVQVSEARSFQK